jgi:hypothetical protein
MNNKYESSLTAPEDRDLVNKWRPEQSFPPLNNQQASKALQEHNITSFIEKFPAVDRTFQDPPVPMQNIGLISFIPAKGAKPNENGVFGFAKLRGNYASELESNQRAEYIIRNVDSYNKIFHTYVGRPFPITVSSQYSSVTEEIDIRKEASSTISNSIKDKKDIEQQQINEIKEREKKLIEESKNNEVNPYDEYITLKVKLAQISWTYLEHQKKMTELKDIILKTRVSLTELDDAHPDYKTTYFDKYMEARTNAGIKESSEEAQDNFIKYLVQDADLGF